MTRFCIVYLFPCYICPYLPVMWFFLCGMQLVVGKKLNALLKHSSWPQAYKIKLNTQKRVKHFITGSFDVTWQFKYIFPLIYGWFLNSMKGESCCNRYEHTYVSTHIYLFIAFLQQSFLFQKKGARLI